MANFELLITPQHVDHLLDALSDHLLAVSHEHDESEEAVAGDLLRRAELLSAYVSAAEGAAEALKSYLRYCSEGDAPDDEGTDDDEPEPAPSRNRAEEFQRLMERHKAWGLEAVPLKVATAEGDTTTNDDTAPSAKAIPRPF